ncbi:MAG TPA: hypothetical protein VFZ31_04695 [Vicinamibacterales bacterium]
MRGLALLAFIATIAAPALAQDSQPPPESTIDASKLGVDLSRIQRGLRLAETKERSAAEGLRLDFSIQVYGQAPRIEVLNGIDLFNGPVPGSAPSHRQMIEHWTPPIYRQPTLPISALAYWAATQIWQKSRKTQCEEEIAAYRALIMQGVNVSAPRCSQ